MSLTGKGGRPPGLPKTGGRKKGIPNRASLTLRENLQAMGCDPGAGVAKIAEDPKNPAAVRLQAYAILMPHMYPKLKPIDHSSERAAVDAHAINKEQALELARELIALFSPGEAPARELPSGVGEGALESPLAKAGDES
jgi:Fe2+ transport system protein FeoA